MEKQRLGPICQTQKDILIDYMDKNPHLQTGRFTKDFTFKSAQKLWEHVTEALNSIPGGANKNWRQWRKTWQDLKKNAKARAAATKKHSCGTGGGGPLKVLTDTDNKINELISPTVSAGLKNINESVTKFDFSETNYSSTSYGQGDVDVGVSEDVVDDKENMDEEDHTYNFQLPAISHTNKTPQKLTKSRKLEHSLKLSQELVKVEDAKKEIMDQFYNEKIEYLKFRKDYESKKLMLLEKSVLLNEEMLDTVKAIKESINSYIH